MVETALTYSQRQFYLPDIVFVPQWGYLFSNLICFCDCIFFDFVYCWKKNTNNQVIFSQPILFCNYYPRKNGIARGYVETVMISLYMRSFASNIGTVFASLDNPINSSEVSSGPSDCIYF